VTSWRFRLNRAAFGFLIDDLRPVIIDRALSTHPLAWRVA